MPLVVGVTGHRDLRAQDIGRLEAEVETVFDRLKSDFLRGEADTPIVLLSALAEGADQLVARVALAHGLRLIAPLPLPPDEYRRDFEPGLNAGAAARQFDELLARASSAPVMAFTAGNSLAAVQSDDGKRAEQYRAVGLFIIENCDVLLALWDGNGREMAAGGTAELVAFKRRGIPFSISKSANASLDGAEIGPVIHVVTPRLKAGSPAQRVETRPWGRDFASADKNIARKTAPPPDAVREDEVWGTFAKLTTLTHDFNAEMGTLAASESGARSIKLSIERLFTDPIDGRLQNEARQAAESSVPDWCQLYGAADTLAQQRQTKFKLDWLALFALGFVAFVLFALLNGFEHAARVLAICYAVAVALIFVVYAKTKMMDNQERFLDYRALAEALRAGIFLSVLGLLRQPDIQQEAPPVKPGPLTAGTITDSYPIKQSNELSWVKLCLRKLERLRTAARVVRKETTEMHAIVRRIWVYGQFLYFRDQSNNHSRRAELLERISFGLIGATWIFLVPLVFPSLGVTELSRITLHDLCVVAVGVLPGLAAALTSYSERLALQAQARQYDRMRSLYARAYELLPEKLDGGGRQLAEAIYWALGNEAMKESADWVATYRQRPVKPLQ